MNFIIFNHDGSIKNVNFAEIIVQGNNLVDEIFVAVEGRSTDSYLATAYFELPNGESNFLTATPYSHSIDQSPYNGYKFLLTGAQTALYGRVRMSLKLEGIQGETLWTYEQVLTINKSGYNPDFTMISMSQYAALLQAMGSLQEKYVVNNARFYSSLANAQADLDNLSFNQCVIIADVTATDPIPEIYFKNSESQLELLAGIGEYTFQAGTTTTQTLAPGSDATVSVSFVASGKTITMNFAFGIPKGDTGATGNGIESIEKHSTQGQVDTYRVTYTNGGYFDFDVTNGTLSGHLASSAFEYDDERVDSLSYQLAAKIHSLVGSDGSKVKSIMASKPTSAGGVTTYSIVWKYNVNIIPGALNIQDGEFYFENNGVLTSIDSNLEDYTFSIFHEVDGTSADDFGYIEIVDTANVGSGTLTQAELVELRKPISFIRYQTGVRSYDMLISYYSARQSNNTVSRYFRGFMHKGSEDFDSSYAYNLSRGFITVTNLDSTTTGGWTYSLNVDAYVDKTPTENSPDLITSGGVYDAVSALDAKILAVDDKVNYAIEAITKKDLYETQEATFQGMTAVPAGAMVKAYLAGFKGNSAVVNQLIPTASRNVNFTTASTTSIRLANGLSIPSGHTILLLWKQNATLTSNTRNTPIVRMGGNDTYLSATPNYNLAKGSYYWLLTTTATLTDVFYWASGPDVDYGIEDVMLIDLTAVPLTSAEMASYEAAKAALKHKDMDVDFYIPYNAGTLTDSKPTKLISNPYNLFNGELRFGGYSDNGSWIGSQVVISNKDPIIVKGGVQYTFSQHNFTDATQKKIVQFDASGNFLKSTYASSGTANQTITTEPNAHTIYFQFTKSSAYSSLPTDPQICFHLASADLGYKPHVPAIEYDLTMPTLKSAGTVQDESKAGGSKVNTIANLGGIDWITYTAINCFRTQNILPNCAVVPAAQTGNILCPKLVAVTGAYFDQNTTVNGIMRIENNAQYPFLYARDNTYASVADFKTGMANVPLNYAKRQATDFSDPISYPEIIDVDAGGLVDVVGEGCDATTKVYFYVEA